MLPIQRLPLILQPHQQPLVLLKIKLPTPQAHLNRTHQPPQTPLVVGEVPTIHLLLIPLSARLMEVKVVLARAVDSQEGGLRSLNRSSFRRPKPR